VFNRSAFYGTKTAGGLNLRTHYTLVPSLRKSKLYLYFLTGLHDMQSHFTFIFLNKIKYYTIKLLQSMLRILKQV